MLPLLRYIVTLTAFSLFLCVPSEAQEAKSVDWISFEQLEDSLSKHPKKVFIDFYTEWCTYCRKMDKAVFTKPEVIRILNNEYYAVRFDAETKQEVTFGNQTFINDQIGTSRNPLHQIARLLATRNDEFTPPVILILDEQFRVSDRYFEYLDSKRLLKVLE